MPTKVHLVSSVQFSSVSQSCPTLCNPMNRSTPGLPVHHHLPEFTKTHVHQVGDAIQPSHPPSSLLLLPPIPPSIRVFSNESTLHMRWPKYWSFSFSIIPSKVIPREYQIELTQTEPLEYKTECLPSPSSTLCRTPHLNNKQSKIQTQSSVDRITASLSLAHQRKNKQTNKQLSTNLTLYEAYTNHWTSHRRAETKTKK